MTLSIIDSIKEFFGNIKEWFVENNSDAGSNPILWIGIILVGLLIFELVFQALHKD